MLKLKQQPTSQKPINVHAFHCSTLYDAMLLKVHVHSTLQKQSGCFNPAKGLYAHCWVVNLQLR